MAAILATVVAIIVYVTLYPFDFHFAGRGGNVLVHLLHSWPARMDRGFARDTILNIGLFIPLGASTCLTFANHWKRRTALTIAVIHGFALSFCVEVLQFYTADRYSSVADILFNTVGALAGALLGLAFERPIHAITSATERRGAPAGVLLAACWMGAQLYPLVPLIKRSQLSRALAQLTIAHLSWVEVIATAAGWFVFGLALRAIWGKLPWIWLALAMLAVPLRVVIWDRVVTASDVAGALLGFALWCVIEDKMRTGAGWLLLLVAVFLRELSPFHFSAAAHAFSWRPFAATILAEHAPGVAIILRKAFEYGALVWLLHAGKVRYRTAVFVVAGGLLVMELLQTHLPGREPEITDPILALLMALILHLLSL